MQTFTEFRADNTQLEALAVLLLTMALFAMTTPVVGGFWLAIVVSKVLICRFDRLKARTKGVGVLAFNAGHDGFAFSFVLFGVAAVDTEAK